MQLYTDIECRPLQYMLLYMISNISDGVNVVDVSQFSNEPSVPIFLDELHCSGDEGRLIECDVSLIHMCSHQQDVGIICQRKYF